MHRFAVLALCSAACGRSQGAGDPQLPGLVVEARPAEPPLELTRCAREPGELGRVLLRPYRVALAALGPHRATVSTQTTVEDRGTPVSELSDRTVLDNGEDGAYHAVYTNSADYGRETIYVGGRLYLRPRYQRWHGRRPETPEEPAALRDAYLDAIAATWDLLAPGVELTDRGPIDLGGRNGRKIELRRAAEPATPAAEPLAQRAWREHRTVQAVTGEIVLDADKLVPLLVRLSGEVGFAREGKPFVMKISLDAALAGVGSPALVTPPAEADVVATPERPREVDDRDYLLGGIAPPLRRNPDGTAVTPQPLARPGAGSFGLLRHVEAPLALPSLLGGFKNGFALSVTGAVVGEMVMGGSGLGTVLTVQRDAVDTTGMFATIAWLCLIAAGAYSLITWWERRSAIVESLT